MPIPDTQEFIIRIGALQHALEITLRALIIASGDSARVTIESLRDEAIDNFKNSEIPADREMDHAKIVGPAIEVIKTMFDDAIGNLDN